MTRVTEQEASESFQAWITPSLGLALWLLLFELESYLK